MRSMVCKKANELIKKGYTRSNAFKKAWKIAKSISGADMKAGNVIRIEYGDFTNLLECTVVSKSEELFLDKYYIINAVSIHGQKIEFCIKPDELCEKAA